MICRKVPQLLTAGGPLLYGVPGGQSESGEGVFAPIEDEQQAEEHATEVGEMGYAVGGKDALEEFDGGVADDEPFGFDGHEEVEIDALVGEHHAEGQQDAVDGSGGPHGDAPSGDQEVAQAGAYAAHEIVDKEAAGPPEVFEDIAEHPEGKHVEEDVAPAGVYEHVGEELPEAETAGGDGVEGQHGGDVVVAVALEHHGGEEHDEVDDEEVFDHRREHAETLG